MAKHFVSIAVECLFDLSVMVLYASFAGLVIAAISVSDRGFGALIPALGYAALLPLAVLVLIVADAMVRALAERLAARKSCHSADGFPGAVRSVLR